MSVWVWFLEASSSNRQALDRSNHPAHLLGEAAQNPSLDGKAHVVPHAISSSRFHVPDWASGERALAAPRTNSVCYAFAAVTHYLPATRPGGTSSPPGPSRCSIGRVEIRRASSSCRRRVPRAGPARPPKGNER